MAHQRRLLTGANTVRQDSQQPEVTPMSHHDFSPSELNSVARLCLIAKNCSPDFLYDAQRFDRVFGAGALANLNRKILNEARCIVERFSDRPREVAIMADQCGAERGDKGLEG